MMRLFLILLLTTVSFKGMCQKAPEDYFDEARKAEWNKDDSTAMADFRYVVTMHPNNALCPLAYFEMGKVYMKNNEDRAAINAYRKAVAAKDDENAAKPLGWYDDIYKNKAAYDLSTLYDKNGNYDSALYFLGEYDTVFQGIARCGNDNSGEVNTAMRYAEINIHANRIRDAEQALLLKSPFRLLPATLVNNEAYYFSPTIKLRELFRKYEQPNELKAELDKSVKNYFMDTVYYKNYGRTGTFIYCAFYFHGAKVRFRYQAAKTEYIIDNDVIYGSDDKTIYGAAEREKIISQLNMSDLYAIVQKL